MPPTRRTFLGLAAFAAVWAFPPGPGMMHARAEPEGDDSRQVTLFGVLATPNNPAIDPKLAKVAPQLSKALPGHGFKLLAVKTQRLTPGQPLSCTLGGGWKTTAVLISPLNPNGKVEFDFDLSHNGMSEFTSTLTSPPNQLSFCDKQLPNGNRLLIAIGAR
jgi:hypothetical protein